MEVEPAADDAWQKMNQLPMTKVEKVVADEPAKPRVQAARLQEPAADAWAGGAARAQARLATFLEPAVNEYEARGVPEQLEKVPALESLKKSNEAAVAKVWAANEVGNLPLAGVVERVPRAVVEESMKRTTKPSEGPASKVYLVSRALIWKLIWVEAWWMCNTIRILATVVDLICRQRPPAKVLEASWKRRTRMAVAKWVFAGRGIRAIIVVEIAFAGKEIQSAKASQLELAVEVALAAEEVVGMTCTLPLSQLMKRT